MGPITAGSRRSAGGTSQRERPSFPDSVGRASARAHPARSLLPDVIVEKTPAKKTKRLARRDVKVVTVRCPYRGRAVSTGIEIEDAEFARLPDTLLVTRCPLCGLEHVVWTSEAWLEPVRYDRSAGEPA
jgi:hypothetical protein